jgi:hypothetical protein
MKITLAISSTAFMLLGMGLLDAGYEAAFMVSALITILSLGLAMSLEADNHS